MSRLDWYAWLGVTLFVVMLGVAGCVEKADAAPARRGTIAYCEQHAAGIVERKCIVRVVFGRRHGRDAVRVAWCESRLDPRAVNGQFRGVFQMGAAERRRYGHGPTVAAQSWAARRYFVASGSDWSPWSCKP